MLEKNTGVLRPATNTTATTKGASEALPEVMNDIQVSTVSVLAHGSIVV